MPEPPNSEIRVLFPAGKQRLFLEQVKKKFSVERMASVCCCSPRSVRDWCREKFPMPLACAQKLSGEAKVPLSGNLPTQNRYSHTSKAGKSGARSAMQKYGGVPVNEHDRKARWEIWWKTEGRFRKYPILQAKKVFVPKDSEDLAEFFGIMMGDGGMSSYQTTISLHHVYDLAYSKFVVRLIEKLFKLKPSVHHRPEDSINEIVVSRKALVDYLHSRGLPIGNKVRQQFDIPKWIKENPKYLAACVRGLVDTDGSVFTHSYVVNGKRYSYKKLSFCSHSRPLQISAAKALADAGLHPRVTKYDVWLDSKADVMKYLSVISTHNPKHLKRYHN